jgi:hypothetical protein
MTSEPKNLEEMSATVAVIAVVETPGGCLNHP